MDERTPGGTVSVYWAAGRPRAVQKFLFSGPVLEQRPSRVAKYNGDTYVVGQIGMKYSVFFGCVH